MATIGQAGFSTPRSLNDYLQVGVVAFLALAPVPLASNRPFFWAMNAVIVGLAWLIFLWAAGRGSASARVPLRSLGVAAALYVAVLLWMLVQLIPLSASLVPLPAEGLAGQGPRPISVDPAATVGALLYAATCGLFFLLVLQIAANRQRARQMLVGIFWVVAAHGAFAIVAMNAFGDRILIFPKWAYRQNATGFFVNANSFATFLAMGAIVGVSLALDRPGQGSGQGEPQRGRLDRIGRLAAHGVGLVIVATALVLTQSRMGFAVAILGSLVAAGIRVGGKSMRPRALVAGCLLVLLVAAAVVLFSGAGLLSRLGSVEQSADDRLLLYRQVIGMIAARPWTGFGAGTFVSAFQPFHQLPLSSDVVWNAAHDTYLELAAGLGVIAAAVAIIAVASIWLRIAGAVLKGARSPAAIVAVGVGIAAAAHSLVDFSLQVEAVALLFAALMAIGSAEAWNRTRQDTVTHTAITLPAP